MPQETTKRFYKFYVNGQPEYQIVPWAGNIPYGMTPITAGEYQQGLQQKLQQSQQELVSKPYARSTIEPSIRDLEGRLNEIQGVNPASMEFGSSGYVISDGTPMLKSEYEKKQANEAGVASGTLRPVSIGKGTGYVPVSSAADQELKRAAQELAYTVAEGAIQTGKTLDPNANYSLVDFTSFLDQAKSAVSPYYQSLISSKVDSFKRNLQSLGADLSAFETKTIKEAEQTRLTKEEQLAGAGMAFSSGREQFAKTFAEETAASLEEARRKAQETAQQNLATTEQAIGTERLKTTLGTTPTIGTRPLTFGTTSTVGEVPYAESEAAISRARALAADENARREAARAASTRASAF